MKIDTGEVFITNEGPWKLFVLSQPELGSDGGARKRFYISLSMGEGKKQRRMILVAHADGKIYYDTEKNGKRWEEKILYSAKKKVKKNAKVHRKGHSGAKGSKTRAVGRDVRSQKAGIL